MKTWILAGVIIAVVGLFSVIWWLGLGQKVSSPPSLPLAPALSSASNAPTSSNPLAQPASPSTNLPTVTPPSSSLKIDPKAQIIESIMASRNTQPQDFYGKVIDQNGKPVEDATAVGTLMQIRGIDVGEKKEIYTSQSDSDGNFEFTGLHGWQLGVVVQKKGYQIGNSAGVYKAPNAQDKTSPSERAIFTMWKLKGAEPMTACSISTSIACDGTQETFNLLTGRGKGNLQVALTRNPINIDRSKPFDWTFTVGIANGGLVEITDAYPNEAPADGYQQSITITMSADDKNWTSSLNRSYYFQSGQTYGRMTINVTANFQPPPTFFGANIYSNPSGSRNLEYDPSKQINP